MKRVLRWMLALAVAVAAGWIAGNAWTFIAGAAHQRGDWYLFGVAYFAAGWVALCGLGVIASIFATREGV